MKKTYTVGYRRKRKGRTDYRKRLKLLLAEKPKLVVRKSLNEIYAQIVVYDEKGDRIIVSARGSELKKFGWNYNYRNITSAYLLGILIAKKAKGAGINEAILDIGLQKSVPGSRIFSVLKGATDNGLKIPHSEDIVPNEERISGKHIEDYANKLKENETEYNKRFGAYLKSGANPHEIVKRFNEIKTKIVGA